MCFSSTWQFPLEYFLTKKVMMSVAENACQFEPQVRPEFKDRNKHPNIIKHRIFSSIQIIGFTLFVSIIAYVNPAMTKILQ